MSIGTRFWPTFWLVLATSLIVTYFTYDDNEFKAKLEAKYGDDSKSTIQSQN
ncbi:MAG: hypothetical protein ACK5AV_03500 [Alphaproteobacteria bacterium]|jgi:peptidoglycan/LPS O-acetylase OafA/YrhL